MGSNRPAAEAWVLPISCNLYESYGLAVTWDCLIQVYYHLIMLDVCHHFHLSMFVTGCFTVTVCPLCLCLWLDVSLLLYVLFVYVCDWMFYCYCMFPLTIFVTKYYTVTVCPFCLCLWLDALLLLYLLLVCVCDWMNCCYYMSSLFVFVTGCFSVTVCTLCFWMWHSTFTLTVCSLCLYDKVGILMIDTIWHTVIEYWQNGFPICFLVQRVFFILLICF